MEVQPATMSHVWRRVVPLFFVLYMISVLDRANVGFAALQMNQDLGFGPATYGFGAGVFFVGYVIVEIPSNLILHRVGARVWLSRILVTWGLVTAATALTSGPVSFYMFRFLLGVAEAGFAPGMLYALTLWFPRQDHARVIAQVWIASAVAIVVGGPFSAAIMQLDGWFGLPGWKLIFIVEGVPAVIAGVVCLFCLTEKPADATWLAPDQRRALADQIAREQASAGTEMIGTTGRVFADPVVWLLCGIYFFAGIGFYGITLWLPQILRQMSGLSPTAVSLVAALPFGLAAVAMDLNGRHSDRTGERRMHLAGALLAGAVSLGASGLVTNAGVSFTFFCMAVMGIWSAIGVFWAVPAAMLRGKAAASGLALINAIGSAGAFVGPYAVGLVRSWTSDFAAALLLMACAVLVAAALSLLLKRHDGSARVGTAIAARVQLPVQTP